LNKSAVVIQGPVKGNLYNLVTNYTKAHHIIFTTDHDCDNIINIYQCRDVVDGGVGNINRQANTTLCGLALAKLMGYEFSLKIRTDFSIPKIEEFIHMLEEMYTGKIIFYTWHVDGYMVDYLMYGKTDDLIDFWTIDEHNGEFAERILLNNYNKKHGTNIVSFEDSKEYFDYCINKLPENNIDFYWQKYNLTNEHYEYHKSTYLG